MKKIFIMVLLNLMLCVVNLVAENTPYCSYATCYGTNYTFYTDTNSPNFGDYTDCNSANVYYRDQSKFMCSYGLRGFRDLANPNNSLNVCGIDNINVLDRECLSRLKDNKYFNIYYDVSDNPTILNFYPKIAYYIPPYSHEFNFIMFCNNNANIGYCSRYKSIPRCSTGAISWDVETTVDTPMAAKRRTIYLDNQGGHIRFIKNMQYNFTEKDSGWYFTNQVKSIEGKGVQHVSFTIYVKFREYRNWYNNIKEPKKEVMNDKEFYISKCVDSNHPEDYIRHECNDQSCIDSVLSDKYFVDMNEKYIDNPKRWSEPDKWTYYTRKDDNSNNPKKYYYCWYPAGKDRNGNIVWDIWSADVYDVYTNGYNAEKQKNSSSKYNNNDNSDSNNDNNFTNNFTINALNGGMFDININELHFINNTYLNYSFNVENNTENNIYIYPFISLSTHYKNNKYVFSFYDNKKYKAYKINDNYYNRFRYFSIINSGKLNISTKSQAKFHLIDFNIDKKNGIFLKSTLSTCLFFINADLFSLKGMIKYLIKEKSNKIMAKNFYSYYCLTSFIDDKDEIHEQKEYFNALSRAELQPDYLQYNINNKILNNDNPTVILNKNDIFKIKIKQPLNDNWLVTAIMSFQVDKNKEKFWYIAKNKKHNYQIFNVPLSSVMQTYDSKYFKYYHPIKFDKEQYLNYNNNILSFSVKDWCKYYGNTTIKLYEFYYYKGVFDFAELLQITPDSPIFYYKIKTVILNCEI